MGSVGPGVASSASATSDTTSAPRLRGGDAWLRRTLSIKNIGAIYVWILVILVFSAIEPHSFPTLRTAKTLLNEYSITGLIALSLVIPLAGGYFDLSIGYVISFSGVFVANLLEKTSMSPIEAALITMVACFGIGLVNAFVVVVLGVDSFIGTLGSGGILAALTLGLTNDQPIAGRVGDGFANLAIVQVHGFQLPVVYLISLMIILGWILERTQGGRRLYAVGFNRETARLNGIATNRIAVICYLTSACLSGFAGLVLAAQVAAGSPDIGPPYLIPAFSACFLGATQLRGGRFNPWGTVIAVLLLGTIDLGLLISGGPTWTPQLFEGVVLIIAVALAGVGRRGGGGWRRRKLRA